VGDNPFILVNSTFVAVVCGLTYLCLDPLLKAAYVLRCFYGESIHTGGDIRVELNRLAGRAAAMTMLFLVSLGLLTAGFSLAHPPSSAKPLSVSPRELNRALDRELEELRYVWRMPPAARPKTDSGVVGGFFEEATASIADLYKAVRRWVKKVREWFSQKTPHPAGGEEKLSKLSDASMYLLYFLLPVLLLAMGIFLWRILKRRREGPAKIAAAPVETEPDLEDEATLADQLPEEKWLALAYDLKRKGRLRLALRAVFLAILAHLAENRLVHIARFKSNLDYKMELGRRAYVEPEMLDTFSRSVAIFDSVWYGMHKATGELFDSIVRNQEILRSCGQEE
jgi:hypothetical protein